MTSVINSYYWVRGIVGDPTCVLAIPCQHHVAFQTPRSTPTATQRDTYHYPGIRHRLWQYNTCWAQRQCKV